MARLPSFASSFGRQTRILRKTALLVRNALSALAASLGGKLAVLGEAALLAWNALSALAAGFGSQNWTFGGFDSLTAEPLKLELPGDCLLCHQAALTSDLTFSLPLLRRFVVTGAVQYRFCPQPGRQVCPF